MLKNTFICKSTILFALVLFGALIASVALQSRTPPVPPIVAPTNSDPWFTKSHYEGFLGQRNRRLLAQDCAEGASDRIRYVREECFTDHVVDIVFHERSQTSTVELEPGGGGYFTDTKGNLLVSTYELGSSETAKLRALLVGSLSELPTTVQAQQTPLYLSALEACFSGQSFLAVRQYSQDAKFEAAANGISASAGLKLERKAGFICM